MHLDVTAFLQTGEHLQTRHYGVHHGLQVNGTLLAGRSVFVTTSEGYQDQEQDNQASHAIASGKGVARVSSRAEIISFTVAFVSGCRNSGAISASGNSTNERSCSRACGISS